jgi:hypothetical protein
MAGRSIKIHAVISNSVPLRSLQIFPGYLPIEVPRHSPQAISTDLQMPVLSVAQHSCSAEG